jgi:hypothetical protein
MTATKTSGRPIRWHRDMAHSGCGRCARAAESAKNDAIVEGLQEATFTVAPDHTATVRARQTRGKSTTC